MHTWSHFLEYEWLFVGVLGRRHSLILWSLDCLRITLVCVIKVTKNVQVATVQCTATVQLLLMNKGRMKPFEHHVHNIPVQVLS